MRGPDATTGGTEAVLVVAENTASENSVTATVYNATTHAAIGGGAAIESTFLGAKPVVADLPFPVASASRITETLLERVTERTRVVREAGLDPVPGGVEPSAPSTGFDSGPTTCDGAVGSCGTSIVRSIHSFNPMSA